MCAEGMSVEQVNQLTVTAITFMGALEDLKGAYKKMYSKTSLHKCVCTFFPCSPPLAQAPQKYN